MDNARGVPEPPGVGGAVLILVGMLVSEIAPGQRQLESRNSVATGKDR